MIQPVISASFQSICQVAKFPLDSLRRGLNFIISCEDDGEKGVICRRRGQLAATYPAPTAGWDGWEIIKGESEHSRRSDLFVVVGSSLVVTPAADMPREALHAAAKLVIINAGDTPLDPYAHMRFWEKIGEVLPPAVQRLKTLMGVE